MALTELKLPLDTSASLPRSVAAFLEDAADRIAQFTETHKDDPIPGFVTSDHTMVYRALHALRHDRANLLPGAAFCEWGSGFGIITCLASMLGFDAAGIEIDARLVDAARLLACDYRLPVEFVHGSYLPVDHVPTFDFEETNFMTLEQGRAAYEELGLDLADFDCVFAYPWPGEDDVVTSIFDQCAARGAVLLTYHGQDALMARRKVR